MSRPRPDVRGLPQVGWDPTLFDDLLRGKGLRFRWSRALPCSCRARLQDHYDPTCARCGATGYLYVNPRADEERYSSRDYAEVQLAFAQPSLKFATTFDVGTWGFGDALLTAGTDLRIGYRDRFIGIEQEMVFAELLERGAAAQVPIGKAGRTTAEQKQALRYEPIDVHYIEADGTAYWRGKDWQLTYPTETEPAKLEWLAGRGPAEGKVYAIHYLCHPVWVVDDATFAIQHVRGPKVGLSGPQGVQTLPRSFRVRLEYISAARGA